MISNAFNIGASGLRTTQKVVDMLSHNIANADTPGYKRLENHNFELNFSGPDNKPFLPAGVDTTISSNNDPWLDKRMADALKDKAMNDAVAEGVGDLEKVTTDSTLESSFTAFMNASHDLQTDPNSVNLEHFNQTGKAFIDNVNRVDQAFGQVADTIQKKVDLNNIRLEALQKKLSELTTQPNSEDVVSEVNFIKQQISQVTGSIAGYNKVLNEIIPPVTGLYNQAKSEVIQGANTSYGQTLIQSNPDGSFAWENTTGNGDIDALVEFGSQKFNWDMGRIKTVVGSMLESADIGAAFSGQNLDATQSAYKAAYGVDLADQAVKLQQYQRMYEANAKVIQTADSMLGTLLNIFE